MPRGSRGGKIVNVFMPDYKENNGGSLYHMNHRPAGLHPSGEILQSDFEERLIAKAPTPIHFTECKIKKRS